MGLIIMFKKVIKKRENVKKSNSIIYNIITEKLGLSFSALEKREKVKSFTFSYIPPKKDFSFKRCEVMQYYHHYDTTDLNVIIERARSLTNIKTYAVITHDKDSENGKIKEPHFHLILTFSDSQLLSIVSKTMKVPCQYINKIHTTTRLAQEYLIHKNDSDKYQYAASDVKANFDYVEFLSKRDKEVKADRLLEIAEKINIGEIREFNLYKYVSMIEYAENKTFFQRCFDYRYKTMQSASRSLNCVFITGTSGSGKTTYAKRYAEKNNLSAYVSSGGKNPLDDYQGQDCIILDDIRSSTYSLSEFLKLTDLHTNSNVGCRYYNKSIAECSLIICTSVQTLDDFYTNVTKEDDEPRIQLYRRFPTYIRMDNEFIYFYQYDKSAEKHTYVNHIENVITKIYSQNTRNLINDFMDVFSFSDTDDINF